MAKPPDDEPPKARRGRPSKNPPKKFIDECNELMNAEKWENLRDKANNLITDYPYSDIGWFFRGNAWAGLGEYQKAITAYNEAIRLDKNNAFYFNKRGHSWTALGEHRQALSDYKETINLGSRDGNHFLDRGNAWAELGEYQRAIADFERARKLAPKSAKPLINRANLRAKLGDHQQAISDYNRAIRLDQKDASALNNRGNSWAELGEYQKAIDDYDEAIKLDQKYTSAFNNRGISWAELGEYQKAINDYDEAIKLDRTNIEAIQNRGHLLARIEAEGAKESTREAIARIVDETLNKSLSNITDTDVIIESYVREIQQCELRLYGEIRTHFRDIDTNIKDNISDSGDGGSGGSDCGNGKDGKEGKDVKSREDVSQKPQKSSLQHKAEIALKNLWWKNAAIFIAVTLFFVLLSGNDITEITTSLKLTFAILLIATPFAYSMRYHIKRAEQERVRIAALRGDMTIMLYWTSLDADDKKKQAPRMISHFSEAGATALFADLLQPQRLKRQMAQTDHTSDAALHDILNALHQRLRESPNQPPPSTG